MSKRVRKPLTAYGLNTMDAARYIGCSEALLRKWRAEGAGPAYSKLGRKISYPVPELKKFLHNNLVNTTES